jgi:hypothetical protein
LFKEELRSYKRDLTKIESKLREQHAEQSNGRLFEAEDHEKGLNPLIEAKMQMYSNEQIANEVAINLKRNNETLVKNINKMGDISISREYHR